MLNKQTLMQGIADDVVAGMSAAGAALQTELQNQLSLPQEPGSIQGGLLRINARAIAIQEEIAARGANPGDYAGVYRDIVAQELSKSVSLSVAAAMTGDWAKSLSDTIATAVADRVDSYVREAQITVPKGQPVQVNLAGPSGGNGATTDDATATIA